MATASIQTGFTSGEVSLSLFGRTDLAKYHQGASTMRNFFVNYRGGAASRAGFRYVLACKQQATSTDTNPPRNISFQFSLNQGYILEFGDEYMRVVSNGAYVVESAKTIIGATRANPIVITSNAHGYSNGDWVYVPDLGGMTELNGLAWIVDSVTTNTFSL